MVNHGIWDLREEFSVREAACLWFDVDPNDDKIPPDLEVKIKGMQRALEEAIRRGKIELAYPGLPYRELISIVTRRGAQSICRKHRTITFILIS